MAQLAQSRAKITALVACLVAVWPATANANDFLVADAAGFDAAIAVAQSGDTILLTDGTYPALSVEHKKSLTIQGSRDAKVAGLHLWRTTDVTFKGFTVTPPDMERAEVRIKNSIGIVLDDLLIDGRDERVGAGVVTDDSSTNVVIRNSELTNCGATNRCVGLVRGTTNTLVVGNKFHDCFDCDFIRGGASAVTVKGNTFDRAVHGLCEGGALAGCGHNDHIQIMGGGPWTILGNTFGVRQGGAASVYVSVGRTNTDNPIHDIRIISNHFSGDAGLFAVKIGDGKLSLMRRISIINNTILSGRIAGLQIESGWGRVPAADQPMVANNVFAVMGWPKVCGVGRFSSNLTMSGVACSTGDVGPANLAEDGRPTAGSALVIDSADPMYAPLVDYAGFGRVESPDRGAFEYGGSGPLPAPSPTGVDDRIPLVRTIMHELHSWSRHLNVYARPADDVGVTKVELRVDGDAILSKTFALPAPSTISFSPKLRRLGRGKRTVAVIATDGDGNSGRTTFTVAVRGPGQASPRVTMLNNGVRHLADEALRVPISATLTGERAIRKAILSVDGAKAGSRRFHHGDRFETVSFTLTEWHLPRGRHTIKVTAVDRGGQRGSASFTVAIR